MITYKKVDKTYFSEYDKVPMKLTVITEFKLSKPSNGLGGITLTEVPVTPYVKDFCTGDDESVSRWDRRFDITNWAFFMAYDGERPVGAVTVASRTKGVNMLEGRGDLAVLWDLRVDEKYKGQGIGTTLFNMAVKWAKEENLTQLKIECQNNNVPAVKFYTNRGATLCAINEYAYYGDEDGHSEVQLLLYMDL